MADHPTQQSPTHAAFEPASSPLTDDIEPSIIIRGSQPQNPEITRTAPVKKITTAIRLKKGSQSATVRAVRVKGRISKAVKGRSTSKDKNLPPYDPELCPFLDYKGGGASHFLRIWTANRFIAANATISTRSDVGTILTVNRGIDKKLVYSTDLSDIRVAKCLDLIYIFSCWFDQVNYGFHVIPVTKKFIAVIQNRLEWGTKAVLKTGDDRCNSCIDLPDNAMIGQFKVQCLVSEKHRTKCLHCQLSGKSCSYELKEGNKEYVRCSTYAISQLREMAEDSHKFLKHMAALAEEDGGVKGVMTMDADLCRSRLLSMKRAILEDSKSAEMTEKAFQHAMSKLVLSPFNPKRAAGDKWD